MNNKQKEMYRECLYDIGCDEYFIQIFMIDREKKQQHGIMLLSLLLKFFFYFANE